MRILLLMRHITASVRLASSTWLRRWSAGPRVDRSNIVGVCESHEQLKITEAEWTAFCKDFDDTMAKFGVPDAEKNELFAIVQSTKGDIVTG